MGTRIQDKSRPTKRPQATVGLDGSPAWDKVRSGKPKIDKKGFPQTLGLAIPVLVRASTTPSTPPVDAVAIGTGWRYSSVASATPGAISNDGAGNLSIAILDGNGNDVSTEFISVQPADLVWIESDYGNWTALVSTVDQPPGGVVVIVVTNEVSEGLAFQPNLDLRLYIDSAP